MGIQDAGLDYKKFQIFFSLNRITQEQLEDLYLVIMMLQMSRTQKIKNLFGAQYYFQNPNAASLSSTTLVYLQFNELTRQILTSKIPTYSNSSLN